jgi:hypothetical protein
MSYRRLRSPLAALAVPLEVAKGAIRGPRDHRRSGVQEEKIDSENNFFASRPPALL